MNVINEQEVLALWSSLEMCQTNRTEINVKSADCILPWRI